MAIVEIHPQPISGPWIEGFVLDRHMISSTPLGYVGSRMQYDNVRTLLGELVFQLKNRRGPADDIIETAAAFVAKRWAGQIDCVICPPPSVGRRQQPAGLLAQGIAARLGLAAPSDVVRKVTHTRQMKNVPIQERAGLLAGAIERGGTSVAGQRVLIVDDLWETGSTMRRTAEVVRAAGAREVHALAMTRTK